MAVVATAAWIPVVLEAQATRALQEPLSIELPHDLAPNGDGPAIRSGPVLSDKSMQDLVRNGFPARLHYRVELWSAGRIFNALEESFDLDVVVHFEPLDKTLRVARITGEQVTLLGQYQDFAAAEDAVSRAFRVPIAPHGGGRFYYAAALDVEILSMNDLDEVERWLRGELRPAVRGERSPGTALTRGLRRLAVRILGGQRRHYDARSETFRL